MAKQQKSKLFFVSLSLLSLILWFAVYFCDNDLYQQYVGSIFAVEENVEPCTEDNYDVRKSKAKETIELFYANSPGLYYAENAETGIHEATSDSNRKFILDENTSENDIKIYYSQHLTLDADGNICLDINNPATNDVMVEYSIVLLDKPDELFYRTGVIKPGEYLYEDEILDIQNLIQENDTKECKAIIGITLFSADSSGNPALFVRYKTPEQMCFSPHVFAEVNISFVW